MSLVSLAVMLLAVLNRTVGWAVMLLAVGSFYVKRIRESFENKIGKYSQFNVANFLIKR